MIQNISTYFTFVLGFLKSFISMMIPQGTLRHAVFKLLISKMKLQENLRLRICVTAYSDEVRKVCV